MTEILITEDLMVAVRAFMNTMLKSDPLCFQQYREFLSQRQYQQDTLANERGMSKGEELKLTIRMPDILGAYVMKEFPQLLTNKTNMYRFMREFPQFTASKEPFKSKYGNYGANK